MSTTATVEVYTYPSLKDESWMPGKHPVFSTDDVFAIFDKAERLREIMGVDFNHKYCLAEAMNIVYRQKKGIRI